MNLQLVFIKSLKALEQQQFDEASKGFLKITKLQPSNCPAWINLALALQGKNDFKGSLQAFERAQFLNSKYPLIWFNKGNLFSSVGRLQEAAECFLRAIVLDLKYEAAHSNLGVALSQLAASGTAVEGLVTRWMSASGDNPIARHYISAIRGDSSVATITEFVERHFDNFADIFDERLSELNYRIPYLIDKMIDTVRPRYGVTLDAGCGTGLCGPLLRPRSSRLIGVDVSAKMINKAASLGIYDTLVQRDLVDYLTDCPDRNELFDLIVAADVLMYFGELSPLFTSARRALRAGGLFVFSVEKGNTDELFKVNANGRYQHGDRYVVDTAITADFRIAGLQHNIGREELGQPVHCSLFALVA